MSSCAIKVMPVKSPTNGKGRGGFRYVAAVLNNAAYCVFSGEYVQSFSRQYLIREEFYRVDNENTHKRFIKLLKEWNKVSKVYWD